MKQNVLCLFIFFLCHTIGAETYLPPSTIAVYTDAVFYDMYASTVSEPLPAGAIRQNNSSYTKKMTDVELNSFGNQVTMNISVGALCDNYDRLAHVFLAFVPKGATTYDSNVVKKIELGRFITPFMNKNVSPTSVPYSFEVNNLGSVFRDVTLRAQYDFWIEFSILGVPYAAQTQVAGCSGRIDTFKGSLTFVTDSNPSIPATNNFLLPMSTIKSFNNYGGTDEQGETMRILSFALNNTVNNANFYVITSNHGANSGGEEYVRRQHYVYLNDLQIFTYKPGGKSCEPYRQFNTQGNGIYGSSPQSASWWTGWNNWCPGDAVPIRKINVGNLPPGNHALTIHVPDAEFIGQQGDFPLSVYLQGDVSGILGTKDISVTDVKIYPNPVSNMVKVSSSKKVAEIEIYSIDGRFIKRSNGSELDIHELSAGVYLLKITFIDGLSLKHKIIKK